MRHVFQGHREVLSECCCQVPVCPACPPTQGVRDVRKLGLPYCFSHPHRTRVLLSSVPMSFSVQVAELKAAAPRTVLGSALTQFQLDLGLATPCPSLGSHPTEPDHGLLWTPEMGLAHPGSADWTSDPILVPTPLHPWVWPHLILPPPAFPAFFLLKLSVHPELQNGPQSVPLERTMFIQRDVFSPYPRNRGEYL